jgi:dihydropteroate synthase
MKAQISSTSELKVHVPALHIISLEEEKKRLFPVLEKLKLKNFHFQFRLTTSKPEIIVNRMLTKTVGSKLPMTLRVFVILPWF